MKKKNFKSKIIGLSFAVVAALAMTASTTFAWFTQNITPKVAQFGVKVITAKDDLNISFKYGTSGTDADWSPFGPTVASKYLGVDAVGNVLGEDGTIGFFEKTADGTIKNLKLTNFSTSYINGSGTAVTEPTINDNVLTLYDRDGDDAGAANTEGATGTYLKLQFKFRSATQYSVVLNTAGSDSSLTLKNTSVQYDTEAPAVRVRAWDTYTTTELPTTPTNQNYTAPATKALTDGTNTPYTDLVDGTDLKTRAAFATRVAFVAQQDTYVKNSGGTMYFDALTGTYTTSGSGDKYAVVEQQYNIWDPYAQNVYSYDSTNGTVNGFPDNAEGLNMAYQYEVYNAAVMENSKPGFAAPATAQITGTAGTAVTGVDNVLCTLQPVSGQDYFEAGLDVYIWLEGFDGDCFNTIYSDLIKIALQFNAILPGSVNPNQST